MNKLIKYAAEYGIEISENMLADFTLYQEMLLEWNGKINLTAITDPAEILVKHFLDSVVLLHAYPLGKGATVVDIGTGAGFPGIPLKIVRPDIQLTLIDSLKKRTTFLEELSGTLGQQNSIIHMRAEDCNTASSHREQYDTACARAVAGLSALCEYCLPYVKVGGVFLAMKGPNVEEEVAQAQTAIEATGGKCEDIIHLTLPNDNKRSVVILRKISHTPPKYPRKAVKITKAPL